MVKSFTTALLKVAALSSVVLCASNAQAQKTLYLCDVATEAELTEDICGVPMKIDHLGDYKYRARYYNENANTEIYFLTSKTSLSLVYGLNNGELDRGPMSKMDPFILPEPNTYYEINLDLDNFTYSLTSYEVADYMDPVFYEYGGDHLNMWFNFIDSTNGEWENTDEAWMQPLYFGYATGPKDVTPFTQDGLNPHLYYTTSEDLYFEAGQTLGFMIHNFHDGGWWNYVTWRTDNSSEVDIWNFYGSYVKPEYLNWWYDQEVDFANWVNSEDYRKEVMAVGGDPWANPTVPNTGEYRLIFDAHLGRAKFLPLDAWEPSVPGKSWNGIQSVATDKVTVNVIGKTIHFGADVAAAKLYAINGREVNLSSEDARTFSTTASNGIYILSYRTADGLVKSQKVVIR